MFSSFLGAEDPGNLEVSAPIEGTLGRAGTIDVSWQGLEACSRYFGWVTQSGLRCNPVTVLEVDTFQPGCSRP